jgi:hypothetical protein
MAEPDAFAAFSPARMSTREAGAADWAAEEGFGDFAAATEERDLAAKLAAAGVAVSPRVVVRDWCEQSQISCSYCRSASVEATAFNGPACQRPTMHLRFRIWKPPSGQG